MPKTTAAVLRSLLPGLLLSGLVVAAAFPLAACSDPQGSPPRPRPASDLAILAARPQRPESAARDLLDALADGESDRIWAMLAPDARQRWPDQQAFTDFLSRKFASRKITYELGPAQLSADRSSAVIAVSLKEEASATTLNGPPLVLARRDDSWAVADPGPLGPQGPLFAAPGAATPVHSELAVPILIYHHFAPQPPPRYDQKLATVTTDAFAQQLAWLSDSGYASITLTELFNAFYYGLPLPPKPVILVFDDGYEDTYLHAFPLLQQHGFGATVAMITGAIDQPDYLSWDQIREMAGAGVQFISHTASHADLAAASAETARAELGASKQALEQGLGRPMQFLVYPSGEPFVNGSPAARDLIRGLLPQEGYVGALLTSSGPPYISIQRADSPYQLHRIPVSGGETLVRFAASIGAVP